MKHPVAAVNAARDLFETPLDGGKNMSVDKIAAHINEQFGLTLTRGAVNEWAKSFSWRRGAKGSASGSSESPQSVAVVCRTTTEVAQPVEGDWDWEAKKARFLAMAAGIAEDCLAPVLGPDGQPRLEFRDDKDRLQAGMALVELVGKINAGKFDPPEAGDRIPKLDRKAAINIVNFFVTHGAEPMPNLKHGPVVEVPFALADE